MQKKPNSDHSSSERDNRVVAVNNLSFSWRNGTEPVLEVEEFTVKRGEHLFLMGPSGCGKSTLLSLLAGVTIPQLGTVHILGTRIDRLGGAERDRFRADHIGYIFQMFNLIPYLSVVENVTLACHFSQTRRKNAQRSSTSIEEEALRLLGHLNMVDPHLLQSPVMELSVGQQQRVAAARAIIGSPELVIGDEPTSSLDASHQEAFIRLLFEECNRSGSTLVFVSHDTSLAPLFDRSISLVEINAAGSGKIGVSGGMG